MEDLDDITIKKAARGDSVAFRKYYDHYAPFVWRVAYRTVNGDADAAARITQDTFIKVHGHLSGFRGDSKMTTWLYGIAWRASIDELRKLKVVKNRNVTLTPDIPGAHRSDNCLAERAVERILSTLTPEERFLLTAREIDDLSFEEISIMTGRTEGSLRTALSRLKDRLREEFRNEAA